MTAGAFLWRLWRDKLVTTSCHRWSLSSAGVAALAEHEAHQP